MRTLWISTFLFLTSLSAHSATIETQLMASAKLDLKQGLATLPLQLGHLKDGRSVYFVLTDASDEVTAKKLGLTYSPQIAAAADAKSTRTATLDAKGKFTFDKGTVDFSPKHQLTAGDAPNFFPPKQIAPGSVGDADYSPFVKIDGTDVVLNAPIVAFNVTAAQIDFCKTAPNYDLVHDKVVSLCPKTSTVTVHTTPGFAAGKDVVYLSFDSNNALPATMESATFAPAMDDLKAVGASQPLYALVNGQTGVNNPDRQGFNSALSGEGAPLNILEGVFVTGQSLSPLWDLNVSAYTSAAIQAQDRHILKDGASVLDLGQRGLLTNPMGGTIQSLGLLVNCPVVAFVK